MSPAALSALLTVAGLLTPSAFAEWNEPLPRLGIGVKASTLGIGVEAGTAVTHRSNVRAGFNAFNYSHGFDKDGVNYDARLILRSFELLYDQYIVGPFHVTPGLLLYNGNKGRGNVSVPAGQPFTLGGFSYFSSRTSPVAGTATLDLGKAAPMVLLGFGNLLPRSARRFAVNVEFGVVFEGSPKASLNLAGSTCNNSQGTICQSVSLPEIQANVLAEQAKLNKSLHPFQYYPVVSIGFGYKFR